MPVYFIREDIGGPIKIGRASDVRRRVSQLQTGNPTRLWLLGWLLADDDVALERELHAYYKIQRLRGEWFILDQDHVLQELKRRAGFVPKLGDAFEIVGYDRDGVPESAGVCEWADFEYYECCPFCGCLCGLQPVSDYSLFSCANCGVLVDDEMGQEPRN